MGRPPGSRGNDGWNGRPLLYSVKKAIMKISITPLLTALGIGLSSACGAQAVHQPNILLILVDDLGFNDLGCQGCTDFATPSIDSIAASGVRITQGYVSHPYCSPSRAGIQTGRYQQRFGHEHNPGYDESDLRLGSDVNEVFLPGLLTDAGYRTAHLGKWHLGAAEPFRPLERGYDQFFGFLGGGHHYSKADGGGEYDGPLWRDGAETAEQPTYLTDDLTNEAIAIIEQDSDAPFFIQLAYNAPHAPDHVPDEHLARHRNIEHEGRRRYAGLVTALDDNVGRILSALESQGIEEETLVIFLSDNGGRRGSADNRPLRGNKGWLHEGGLRVPFLMSWPGVLEPGTTYDKPIIALDLLPTALGLANVPLPNNLDGKDLMPYLTGSRTGSPHDVLHWRVCGGLGFALRRGDWKLVQDVSMGEPALYNLAKDIGEDRDLAASRPELVGELLALHLAWDADLREPDWTEGHAQNVRDERRAAEEAGTRQFPMPWVK